MRLPRITAATAVASMLLAGAAGCTSDDDAPDGAEVVVIAADLNNSSVDTAYARALQLRVDQINASGQLGDRELRLVTKDNRNDPAASMRNITSFADDPTVAAVVSGSCDDCVVGAAKTINDKAIPTIALSASDAVTTPVSERQYVFKLGPNSKDSTAALVNELVRQRIRTISVLYTTDLYGRGANIALNNALPESITVKAVRSVKPGASDIAQSVGTLTDAAPQALVVLTPPDLAQLAARDARAAGFSGRVYLDAAAAGDLFIPREAVAATNNATMVFTQILAIDDVIATTPAKSSRKQWFRDYTSRYGSYSGVASFAADAADLIADAVARVGADRPRIREIIETSQVDGLSGPIRLTPDNHSGLMPQALTLLVARSGRWRLAS
ncbi:branched-chain amino acid ABC transporter [Paractinoplanes abujensis]|uniref:Branched-chain amino acid transport system substrate-binding protein n=2 Tax=Paractinoplanes abujensis TaxID=882441 RepID=A0A7W7G5W3_9ACTN|nr:ABC transporter substrate-binding protein [Actinoplanes abujensis]MBB4695321.1 branched-chain amino acid transport system substrate-binding protein [Actinoplanes abujensis]GID24812.1 branched-chain amino acid ABC transporter [Actinoplanes abujensis]